MSKLEIEIDDSLLVDLALSRRNLRELMKGHSKYTLPSGATIQLSTDQFPKMLADCIPEAIKNYKLYSAPNKDTK